MNFNFPETVKKDIAQEPVEVGNVYASKNTHKTVAWVVVGVSASGSTIHLLGLDAEGQVSSTASYNTHSFSRRVIVGRCDLGSMSFDVIPM